MEQVELDIADLLNSEISKLFLHICASSPAAVADVTLALQQGKDGLYLSIPYETIVNHFSMMDLVCQCLGLGGSNSNTFFRLTVPGYWQR